MKKLLVFTLLFSAVLLAGSFWQELPAQAAAPVDILTTIAGGAARDGGLATDAVTNSPRTVVFDSAGNLYFADSRNNRVRKVDAASGIITTVAGTGEVGFSGDGGPATNAQLNSPRAVGFDSAGNVYVGDSANHRVRKVDVSGTITTIAGSGVGDGFLATDAILIGPRKVVFDSVGNFYTADESLVRKISLFPPIITIVAGNSISGLGFSGDGGLATDAQLSGATDVEFDSLGNLYIADSRNNRIRKVDNLTGIITTVAGTGAAGFSGDGGPATSASIRRSFGVSVDGEDNLYIADNRNNRVRKVDASTGIISTIAGIGIPGESGDGGPAVNAEINAPSGVGIDDDGIVYISGSRRIRVITPPAHPLVLLVPLAAAVIDLNLDQGIENSLVAKLESAFQKLDDDNPNNDGAAVNKLEAFINQLEAQSGKKIDPGDADNLIAAAEEIVALLLTVS